MINKGYVIAGAIGAAAYIGLNLSTDFKEAKDRFFTDTKVKLCELTDGAVYDQGCTPSIERD